MEKLCPAALVIHLASGDCARMSCLEDWTIKCCMSRHVRLGLACRARAKTPPATETLEDVPEKDVVQELLTDVVTM